MTNNPQEISNLLTYKRKAIEHMLQVEASKKPRQVVSPEEMLQGWVPGCGGVGKGWPGGPTRDQISGGTEEAFTSYLQTHRKPVSALALGIRLPHTPQIPGLAAFVLLPL